MRNGNDALSFPDAVSEIAALREVVVPMEGETVFACVKKRLRNAKRVEETAEKLVKGICKKLGESNSADGLWLLDYAGVLDKDGVARIDHPLFFALSKDFQKAALAKNRGQK